MAASPGFATTGIHLPVARQTAPIRRHPAGSALPSGSVFFACPQPPCPYLLLYFCQYFYPCACLAGTCPGDGSFRPVSPQWPSQPPQTVPCRAFSVDMFQD